MSNTAKNSKQGTSRYLKLVLAILAIFWLIKTKAFDFTLFSKIMSPLPWILGLLFVFIGVFINNLRWQLLLKAISQKLSQFYLLRLSLLGVFYSFVAPGGLGGDVVKGYTIYKQTNIPKSKVALSILFDRGSGMLAMLIMASLAGIYYIHGQGGDNVNLIKLVKITGVLIAISAVSIGIFFSFKKKSLAILKDYLSDDSFEKINGILHVLTPLLKQLLLSILISCVAQGFFILMFYFISEYLGYGLQLSSFFIFVPLGMICSALPLSPAGVGVGQAAFYYLFSLYDEKAGALGVMAFTFFQALLLIWGIVGIAISFIENKRSLHVR